MAFRKFRLASSRCSAGEATLGEFGSELCDRPEGPRVKTVGRIAMAAAGRQIGAGERALERYLAGREHGVRNEVGESSRLEEGIGDVAGAEEVGSLAYELVCSWRLRRWRCRGLANEGGSWRS